MADEQVLRFEAPVDSIVDQLMVRSGRVAPGQLLLILRSPELDRLIFRVTAFQQHLEIAERAFQDGRVDEQIAALVSKRDDLTNAVKIQEDRCNLVKSEHAVGKVSVLDIYTETLALSPIYRSQIDAKLAADQAEKKKQDMIDKFAITKSELQNHETYLQAPKSAMTITASLDGTFNALVCVGSFVKKGHTVGEIVS